MGDVAGVFALMIDVEVINWDSALRIRLRDWLLANITVEHLVATIGGSNMNARVFRTFTTSLPVIQSCQFGI